MPVQVSIPIRLKLDEAELDEEQWSDALYAALTRAVARSRREVLAPRGGYTPPLLHSPTFSWSGIAVDGMRRAALEERLAAVIDRVAADNGMNERAPAPEVLPDTIFEVLDEGRFDDDLGLYSIDAYRNPGKRAVHTDSKRKGKATASTTVTAPAWARFAQGDATDDTFRHALFGKLQTLFPNEQGMPDVFGILYRLASDDKPLYLNIYRHEGQLRLTEALKGAKIFRVAVQGGKVVTGEEGRAVEDQFKLTLVSNGDDEFAKALIATRKSALDAPRKTPLSKHDYDQKLIDIEQDVTRAMETIRPKAAGYYRWDDGRMIYVDAALDRLIRPTNGVAIFGLSTMVTGEAVAEAEKRGAGGFTVLTSQGEFGSGGKVQGTATDPSQSEGSGSGDGPPEEGGSGPRITLPADVKAPTSKKATFPNLPGGKGIPFENKPYGNEPSIDLLRGPLAEEIRQLIVQIAYLLQIEESEYAAQFAIFAGKVINMRANASADYSLTDEHEGLLRSPRDGRGQLGPADFTPSSTPAIQLLWHIGFVAPLVRRLIDCISELYPKRVPNFPAFNWRVEARDALNQGVAWIFIRGCQLNLLQLLRSSRKQILARLAPEYFESFRNLCTALIVPLGEAQLLLDHI
ncbi:MAG TPA: hypothetical protein VGL13_04880, partial [Polyangiaceae bacterium]